MSVMLSALMHNVRNCCTFLLFFAGSFVWQMLDSPIFTAKKGEGWLDGGAPFYATYKTKDDKYVAVGALEAQFYSKLIEGKNLFVVPSY